MNRLILVWLLAAAPVAFAQGGWISLFNGKDFTGWKIGGDQNTFKIKDGAMVAKVRSHMPFTMDLSTIMTSKILSSW